MKALPARRVLLPVSVLVVALAGFGAIALRVYSAGSQTRDLARVVFDCATAQGRMPTSFDDLAKAGYAQPGDTPGTYVLLAGRQGRPLGNSIPATRFEVAWGVQPDLLVERDQGVFWRDRPSERVLLVRHKEPPWVVRVFGGRMAMAFPVELYRELIQKRPPRGAE